MGRRKELPVLEKVLITDIGAEGNAIARVDNLVVFVPMLIPGDIVDLKVTKKRKKYLEGRVIRFHEYSKDRISPACKHFGVCGGCKWQHLPYDIQLKYKEKQVIDSIERIGHLSPAETKPVVPAPDQFYYRNKLEYTFSDKRWLTQEELIADVNYEKEDALGFHIPGLFDKVLDIKECLLQPDPSNAIREGVKRYARRKGFAFFNLRQQSGFLRNLIIRNTPDGQVMVIVVFFLDEQERREDLLNYLADEFPQITSLYYIINTKKNDSIADQEPVLYKGSPYITESMEGMKFRIGPKSFFQTNSIQALKLYTIARDYAALSGTEVVYDLYTGTGTIANFVAPKASKVIGIEFIEEAVEAARENSAINGTLNTLFFAGDMKNILTEGFIQTHGRPDVIITDPPRAGMHDDVIKTILAAEPLRIVYVSCNPSTQARDMMLLSEKYNLTSITPVDMFPHTHHIENVALLTLSGNR